jgi:nitrate reductase alpha subunit
MNPTKAILRVTLMIHANVILVIVRIDIQVSRHHHHMVCFVLLVRKSAQSVDHTYDDITRALWSKRTRKTNNISFLLIPSSSYFVTAASMHSLQSDRQSRKARNEKEEIEDFSRSAKVACSTIVWLPSHPSIMSALAEVQKAGVNKGFYRSMRLVISQLQLWGIT